jgi:hypothetical protein
MTADRPRPLIRTIYLYLFALVGLALLAIGTVRLVDLGMKAVIFTRADQSQRTNARVPQAVPVPVGKGEPAQATSSTDLTPAETTAVKQWLADYRFWQETQAKIDLVQEQRQRDASTGLALLIVGLPLYLYHWATIRKETPPNA